MNKKSVRKQKEQKKKNRIIIVTIIVVAVVILAIVAVIIMSLNLGKPEEINDDYFVTDSSKIVLSLDDGMSSFVDGEFEPEITHIVYYNNGEKISNIRIFFVYDDNDKASAAYDWIGDNYKDWASSKELNGKYIIFQDSNTSYENLSTETIKDRIENIKAVGGALWYNVKY